MPEQLNNAIFGRTLIGRLRGGSPPRPADAARVDASDHAPASMEPVRMLYDKSGRPFLFCRGMNVAATAMLPGKSQEPHTMRWTPRDHQSRFVTQQTAKAWQFKYGEYGHTAYSLFAMNGDLAGFGWGNMWPLPELFIDAARQRLGDTLPLDTLELRLYEGYRGRGLAERFAGALVVDYANVRMNGPQGRRPGFSGLWVAMPTHNKRAQEVAANLDCIRQTHQSMGGFEELAAQGGRTVMVLEKVGIQTLSAVMASRQAREPIRGLHPQSVFAMLQERWSEAGRTN